MCKFNSDDHYIYYCGQESLALIVKKRVWNALLGCNLKNNRIICLFPRQKIQHHSNLVYGSATEAEGPKLDRFYKDLQDLLEVAPKNDIIFIWDWNAKVGSQELSWVPGKIAIDSL